MRFAWWRFRVAWIINRTCGWRWRTAWEYAGSMRDPYFMPGEEMTPSEAIHEDQQYWD